MIWILLLVLLIPTVAQSETLYVRPSATCPNNGDGTAYACASGAGLTGAYSNLGGVSFGAGVGAVSNGDTLYICGQHWEGNDGTRTDNTLTPTTSAIIDGNCPSDTGSILSANHVYTSGWTGPDQYGAYSRSDGGCPMPNIAQLVNGVPTILPDPKSGVPDGTWIDGSFYNDCAGNYYVRPLGGVSANSTTIYTSWTGAIIPTGAAVTIQNLTIYGLSTDYCIKLDNADNSIIQNVTVKWCAYIAIGAADGSNSDDVLVQNNTISESGNGIYVNATTTVNNNDRWRIINNSISDLDRTRRYASYVSDNHAIGVAGGDGHLIASNTITGLSGSCITVYDYPAQSMLNMRILNNTCSDVEDISGLSPLNQYGIEYGSTNTGHVANDVAGGVVAGNLLKDVTATCFFIKTSHATVGNDWVWANNTAVNCGTGLLINDFQDGDIGFVFKNNILYNATTNIDHIQNGTDTLTNIIINNNLYSTDGATSFEWNGTKSAFAAWKTNSSQDAASFQTDPLFVNASSDFRLQAASVGRSSGARWFGGIAAKDVRGRPFLSPPDIGAYQSSSGDPSTTRSVAAARSTATTRSTASARTVR